MPETVLPANASITLEAETMAALGGRSVVLVGMMGAGKSTIGRRLSARLGMPFLDADAEIEAAAGMSIPDIFESRGEPDFRDGEARVIARLLDSGPAVLATGGGAFMRQETRDRIRDKAVSIWLKAEADIIMRRVKPFRSSAAADRRSRIDRRASDQRTRAGLSAGRSDDLVARRAAREDRRRMHRGPARASLRRRRHAKPRQNGRHAMTAPLKHSDPITVDVALGDRAYDIIICLLYTSPSPRD